MSEIVLQAAVREHTGKKAKYVRTAGSVPGVFYQHGEGNISIQVERLNLNPLIYTSETHVIQLRLPDGTVKKCILRDVQYDPVSDLPVHFDLQGLFENEKLTLEIPVSLTGGIPRGVRDGGMLQHVIHKLRVSCLPKDIPEKVEVNIADLGINQAIHVSDLSLPEVMILDSPESTVVAVLPPTVVKEEVAAVAPTEEAKEPEVVGKGKKAEEGEGEAPEGAKK
jgi:large subunit ribosomal protein L25